MNTLRLSGIALFIIMVISLAGCAKPGSKSYEKKVHKLVDSVYVQLSSTQGALPQGSRLGVLPFDCTTPQIGETVSNYTSRSLKEGGFVLIDHFEMTQLLKQKEANFLEMCNNKDYEGIIRLAQLDYLLAGAADIASASHKRIMSADAYCPRPEWHVGGKGEIHHPEGENHQDARRWRRPCRCHSGRSPQVRHRPCRGADTATEGEGV